MKDNHPIFTWVFIRRISNVYDTATIWISFYSPISEGCLKCKNHHRLYVNDFIFAMF